MSKLTKIIYFVLFLLLITHPHFISGHIYSLPKAYIQSLITIAIAGVAMLVYTIHQKDIKKKETEITDSKNKLIDAYQYLGQVNNQIPLLKNITSDLFKNYDWNTKDKKYIFEYLLAIITNSVTQSKWGLLRFVNSTTGNTIKEFSFSHNEFKLFKTKISNKSLLKNKAKLKKIGKLNSLQTSDNSSLFKCFLIFPNGKKVFDKDITILQSIVDQAQLAYKYAYY